MQPVKEKEEPAKEEPAKEEPTNEVLEEEAAPEKKEAVAAGGAIPVEEKCPVEEKRQEEKPK